MLLMLVLLVLPKSLLLTKPPNTTTPQTLVGINIANPQTQPPTRLDLHPHPLFGLLLLTPLPLPLNHSILTRLPWSTLTPTLLLLPLVRLTSLTPTLPLLPPVRLTSTPVLRLTSSPLLLPPLPIHSPNPFRLLLLFPFPHPTLNHLLLHLPLMTQRGLTMNTPLKNGVCGGLRTGIPLPLTQTQILFSLALLEATLLHYLLPLTTLLTKLRLWRIISATSMLRYLFWRREHIASS